MQDTFAGEAGEGEGGKEEATCTAITAISDGCTSINYSTHNYIYWVWSTNGKSAKKTEDFLASGGRRKVVHNGCTGGGGV